LHAHVGGGQRGTADTLAGEGAARRCSGAALSPPSDARQAHDTSGRG
jgi:hypothetical protein